MTHSPAYNVVLSKSDNDPKSEFGWKHPFGKLVILIFPAIIYLTSCQPDEKQQLLTDIPVIPAPVSVEATGNFFELSNQTNIYYQNIDHNNIQMTGIVSEYLSIVTGQPFNEKTVSDDIRNGIIVTYGQIPDLVADEGYSITISEDGIRLEASSANGVKRGAATLAQIIALTSADNEDPGKRKIPTGVITDYPVYPYRGFMLDVSRHFFHKDEIMQLINWLAIYKINHLHLHLTDDQGWRIAIENWPLLTEKGGSTEVGGGEGGFYTREDFVNIVAYAKRFGITIVPEIDMPGHTNAALASYPSLNCDGRPQPLYTGIEVGFSSLCVSKELTYDFVDDVISEISAISGSKYFHVGGDESHVTPEEDYRYFLSRVRDLIASHELTMIGWGEITDIHLDSGSLVQIWHSEENVAKALQQEVKMIFSPAHKAYLDMKYDSATSIGLKWAGYISVQDAYEWSPETIYGKIPQEAILGVEAPLWTETVQSVDDIGFLAFPRLPGYAEIGWTSGSMRNWHDYRSRLSAHSRIFKLLGINFYHSAEINWQE